MRNNYKIYFRNNVKSNFLLFADIMVVGAFATLSISIIKSILNQTIDQNFETPIVKQFIFLIMVSLILFVVKTMLPVLKNITYWQGISNYIEVALDKVLYSEYSEMFNKRDSSKLWTDINLSASYNSMYYESLCNIIFRSLRLLMYIVTLMSISKYALITLIPVFLINTFFLHKIKTKLQHYQTRFLESSQELSARIIEYFTLIRNIRAKNREEYFTKIVDRKQDELNDSIIKSSFIQSITSSFLVLISNIMPVLLIIITINYMSNSPLSVGDVSAIYLFIPLIFSSVQEIYNFVLRMLSSKPFRKSLNDLLNIPDEKNGSLDITGFIGLKTRNLMIKVDDDKYIQIDDFEYRKGDKILVSGISGCGKSSLFNVLVGLNKNYTGDVYINDVNLREINLFTLRQMIGYTFQENSVFNLPMNELIKMSLVTEISTVLDICELNDVYRNTSNKVIDKDNISGGEKSRINLAQVLIRKPDVLLIDEIFSSVDEDMERRILNKLMTHYPNLTIIYISHRKCKSISFDYELIISGGNQC